MFEYPSVLVINLPECRERRDFMNAQAERLGFVPEFFPAVDGRQPHPLFDHIDHTRRQRYKGRPFTPGERGCWASHYLIWQRCVALDQAMIVLEDDAELNDGFIDFLGAARALAEQVPYARLYLGTASSNPVGEVAGYEIRRHRQTPFGTVGYLLTPSAAKRFLASADRWLLAVDDYMDLAWKHRVQPLAISPPVVTLRQEFGSLVQSEAPKLRISLPAKVLREAFRAYLSLRHIAYRLASASRNPLNTKE